MEIPEFDKKFQQLFSNMVEIAFEFVGRNKDEIDAIFIYASMENNEFFYNNFYKVKGQLVKTHKINTISSQKYDLSSSRTFAMLNLGNKYLEETAKLFSEAGRQVPTLMKMTYYPKTGKFNNDISYDLHYSNDPNRSNVEGFNEWYTESEKANNV